MKEDGKILIQDINGVEKTLADGFIITEISSDELNQATLKIIHSLRLDLQEKDRIEIIDSTTIEDTEVETFHYYFYLGNYGKGIIKLFTINWFMLGTILDLIKIASGGYKDNSGQPLRQ